MGAARGDNIRSFPMAYPLLKLTVNGETEYLQWGDGIHLKEYIPFPGGDEPYKSVIEIPTGWAWNTLKVDQTPEEIIKQICEGGVCNVAKT